MLGPRRARHLPDCYAWVRVDRDGEAGWKRRRSRRSHFDGRYVRHVLRYRPVGEPSVPQPGWPAAFPTERRRLDAADSTETMRYTDVRHGRWTRYPTEASMTEDALVSATGSDRPVGEPALCCARASTW